MVSLVIIEISEPPRAHRRQGGARSGGSDAVQVRPGEGILSKVGSEAAEGHKARPQVWEDSGLAGAMRMGGATLEACLDLGNLRKGEVTQQIFRAF